MKIGTIGTGFIVSNFINASRSNENCEVVACYSRKLETGTAFAEKNGVAKVYTDLNEMLNDETIDTIYVASPNSVHYEQTKMALNAGKNVICETHNTSSSFFRVFSPSNKYIGDFRPGINCREDFLTKRRQVPGFSPKGYAQLV